MTAGTGYAHAQERAAASIALFLNALPGGGAERNILDLAGRLAERGRPVDLVLAARRGRLLSEVPAAARLVELGTASRLATLRCLLRLPPGNRLTALAMFERLPLVRSLGPFVEYLRRVRPAAIITTLPKNAILALWARQISGTGTRIVIREANTFSIAVGGKAGRRNRILTRIARSWYPRADSIVAVSNGVAKDLADFMGIDQRRITTIHNSVDLERIDERAAEAVDDPWLLPGQPPVVLSTGRLSRQKDHATLLRAFALLRRECDLRLVILGEGRLRSELQALSRELGIGEDVRLAGFVPNPYAYMARSAVFVLSSAWEGFPNVLVEALACGCSIVSTDCPHGPDEILEGGRYGLLSPVGDPAALAERIGRALAAPIDETVLRRRARAFSPERVAERYLAEIS